MIRAVGGRRTAAARLERGRGHRRRCCVARIWSRSARFPRRGLTPLGRASCADYSRSVRRASAATATEVARERPSTSRSASVVAPRVTDDLEDCGCHGWGSALGEGLAEVRRSHAPRRRRRLQRGGVAVHPVEATRRVCGVSEGSARPRPRPGDQFDHDGAKRRCIVALQRVSASAPFPRLSATSLRLVQRLYRLAQQHCRLRRGTWRTRRRSRTPRRPRCRRSSSRSPRKGLLVLVVHHRAGGDLGASPGGRAPPDVVEVLARHPPRVVMRLIASAWATSPPPRRRMERTREVYALKAPRRCRNTVVRALRAPGS